MKTIIKTYKVTYILGFINPIEKSIEITTSNNLSTEYIREEIIKKNPSYERFIGEILSQILIDEKVIGEDTPSEEIKDKKDLPVFNW